MHHRNHKNSSSNHSNPQHMQPKPQFPSSPAPQRTGKSVLRRFTEKFKEQPATREEVQQLGLNAKREIYKTQIQKAKRARPSRFTFGGGFQSAPPSYRRSSSRAPPQTGSWLLGEPSRMGDSFFSGGDSGPSLDFITGGSQKTRGKKQNQGFGQGLNDLFT